MLKKTLIILIFITLAGWGTKVYLQSHTETKVYKVFSSITTIKQVKEEGISSIDIIELTNKERLAVGLPPLSTNILLDKSAEMKVDDMVARQYFEHVSPTGEGVSDLGKKVGYEYVIMGENLAVGGFTSSADIVTAWMNSAGHKANILNKKYQEIGVSVKRATYEGKEVWFAVQHFGTSRSVCPSIDGSLKKQIDSLNQSLKVEEGIISSLKKELESSGASSKPSYQSEIDIFNKKVDEYNAQLKISRQKIESYNIQVREFNKCIATFQ
jgi:uncharacterized protein YkwD/uncharacterized protein YukE